jgi:hypothetical protein
VCARFLGEDQFLDLLDSGYAALPDDLFINHQSWCSHDALRGNAVEVDNLLDICGEVYLMERFDGSAFQSYAIHASGYKNFDSHDWYSS